MPELKESLLEELITEGTISNPDKARRRFRLGYPTWFILGASHPKEVPGVLSAGVLGRRVRKLPRLAQGTELLGEYEGSGFKEPVYLMRRVDGQVIQSSRLLYLVAAEADGKDFEQIASQVRQAIGQGTRDDARHLCESTPQGLVAVSSCSESHHSHQ